MESEKRLVDSNEAMIYAQKVFSDTVLLYAIKNVLDNSKTVDAAPVVHGRWEQVQRWATKAKYRCSVCGREIMSATKVNIEKYPYCHCGAKMDGDGNV